MTIEFNYYPNDLQISPNVKHTLDDDQSTPEQSDFNALLCREWNQAQCNGYFRYLYKNDIPSKIVSDKFKFIIQLNPDRALKRRRPQNITSPNQPFDPHGFNFSKVNTNEIILELKFHETSHTEESNIKNLVLINVSPLEFGHVLFIPNMYGNEPQRITSDGLKLAVHCLLLNYSSDFRVGFNSLCGYASVNHHHYHGYYLKHRLSLESMNLRVLGGSCHVLSDLDYPAQGFVFILRSDKVRDVEKFIMDSIRLIAYLQEQNFAHNVFVTRGSTENIIGHFDSIRMFIWARESSHGAKQPEAFSPAVFECAGHFLIKTVSGYDSITNDMICRELRNICQEKFDTLCPIVRSLFSQTEDSTAK